MKKYYLPLLSTKKIKKQKQYRKPYYKRDYKYEQTSYDKPYKKKRSSNKKISKKPITCWKCKQQGHYATKCPMKNQIKS